MMPGVGSQLYAGISKGGGAPLVTLVANMGLAATYQDYKAGPINQTNTITVNFLSNGTWTVSGNGGSLTGTPTSGNWGTPTTAGAGASYEIEIVDNTGAGGGGTKSGDTGSGTWVSMVSGRTLTLSITDTSLDDGLVSASRSFTATIRQIGTTTPTSADTFTLNPQADKTSV